MKLSDDFDARRLRPRGPGRWRLRLGACIALLGILGGLSCAGLALLSLLYNPLSFAEPTGAAAVLLSAGIPLLLLGILTWRLCRRRLHRTDELSMAPHLLKKHH